MMGALSAVESLLESGFKKQTKNPHEILKSKAMIINYSGYWSLHQHSLQIHQEGEAQERLKTYVLLKITQPCQRVLCQNQKQNAF